MIQGKELGTVTIFYGFGSGPGSEFWQVTVPVPSFDKLRLGFWFPNTEGGKIKLEGQNAWIGQHDWFKGTVAWDGFLA